MKLSKATSRAIRRSRQSDEPVYVVFDPTEDCDNADAYFVTDDVGLDTYYAGIIPTACYLGGTPC